MKPIPDTVVLRSVAYFSMEIALRRHPDLRRGPRRAGG
jgi:hypothetical protein